MSLKQVVSICAFICSQEKIALMDNLHPGSELWHSLNTHTHAHTHPLAPLLTLFAGDLSFALTGFWFLWLGAVHRAESAGSVASCPAFWGSLSRKCHRGGTQLPAHLQRGCSSWNHKLSAIKKKQKCASAEGISFVCIHMYTRVSF